jgi:hypothetical protein
MKCECGQELWSGDFEVSADEQFIELAAKCPKCDARYYTFVDPEDMQEDRL